MHEKPCLISIFLLTHFTGEDKENCLECVRYEPYDGLNIILTVPHDGQWQPTPLEDRRSHGCCDPCDSSDECVYDHVCDNTHPDAEDT